MGTVDELLVEKFSSIFEDKFFPEIAPQNIVENDKCFCVFSLPLLGKWVKLKAENG